MGAVDVLKIDVDGFDGQVLRGADRILSRDRPAVIFEWHPILCERTSNNWTDHFEALKFKGYEQFVWFTKYGEFSHFMCGYDPTNVAMLAELCLNSESYDDLHFDVVALPPGSVTSPQALADLPSHENARPDSERARVFQRSREGS